MSVVRFLKRCLSVFVVLMYLTSVNAEDNTEKVDYLALAALLIQDKQYDKAANALVNIDEKNETLDRARYFTIRGLVNLNTERYENAVKDFNAALLAGQQEKFIHLYLAQAYFYLQKYQLVISELDRGGEVAEKNANTYLMRSQAYWKLEQHENAWQVLDQAQQNFAGNGLFARQKVFMLMELGLYQQAVTSGKYYLENYAAKAIDYIVIGQSMLSARQISEALEFLEQAVLRFPENEKARLALAHAYVAKRELNVAADIMQDVSVKNTRYVTDASELYRRAGRHHKALNLALYSSNQKDKLKQRLAIYLQAGLIDNIRAMEEDLLRSGLLKNDEVIYALAYALFKSGRFELAEDYLKKIRKSATFKKATVLRKAMSDCQQNRWKCY